MDYIAKYIHGSEDSVDIDVMYVVNKIPDLSECKTFCSDKDENRNLIVIKDGIITDCYKGTVDECNNALFETYKLHHQQYPLMIERTVQRNIPLKAVRAIRSVLSHLSRSIYRTDIKKALKSDFETRLNVLKSIDIEKIDFETLNNNMSGADIRKVIAFQIGQTIGLIEGVENYTKKDIAYNIPSLEPFLYRKPEYNIQNLKYYLSKFYDKLYEMETESDGTSTYFREFEVRIDLIKEKIL